MSAPNVPYPRYPAPARMARPPRRHMNPWVIRLALLGVTGLILLFFTLLVLVSGYQFVHQDEIYPGVSTVLDVDLAGMTRQEAIAALSERFTYADEATFVFRHGEQTWDYSAADLGVSLDVQATVDEAFRAGRGGSWLENLIDQMDMRANGYPVAPVITYNQTQAERILTRIAADIIDRPTLDSTLTIRDGKALATPRSGAVDIPTTRRAAQPGDGPRHRAEIMRSWRRRRRQGDRLRSERINLALSAPVKFTITGDERGPWVSETASIEKMLVIDEVRHEDGTASYEVGLSLDQAREFLTELAPELSVQPQNARFVFDDETRQLQVIQNSVNGRVLDVEGTLAKFEAAVFAENAADRRVELVFQDIAADVPDTATAAQLGITELVTQKTTYYYGSTAARVRNIEVATSNFHGLVIPPGGIFSFNEWLGDVSVESGYEQGLIIVGNQTITGVGGGVCVATTAFQCVLRRVPDPGARRACLPRGLLRAGRRRGPGRDGVFTHRGLPVPERHALSPARSKPTTTPATPRSPGSSTARA